MHSRPCGERSPKLSNQDAAVDILTLRDLDAQVTAATPSNPAIADFLAFLPSVVREITSTQPFYSAKAAPASSEGVPKVTGCGDVAFCLNEIETIEPVLGERHGQRVPCRVTASR